MPFESLGIIRFRIRIGSILYHFRNKAIYISRKSRFYPLAFDAPFGGSLRRNIAIRLGMEKLECCDYPTMKKFDDVFSRFDTIPACYMDRQADRHLATSAI